MIFVDSVCSIVQLLHCYLQTLTYIYYTQQCDTEEVTEWQNYINIKILWTSAI